MTEMTTLERLTPVFRDVFDNDNIVATADLTAQKVSGWDSLTNVRLFVEIERTFRIRFSALEIGSLTSVGQLADLIDSKIHSSAQ